MKKTLISSLVILTGIFTGFSQTAPPQGINYQAVAMDNSSRQIAGADIPPQPVSEKEIRVRFSIIKNSVNGSLTYREVHLVKTDAFGLFNTVIGQGFPDVSPMLFEEIAWETGSHFLKVEMDITGGFVYQDLGTQQLWSVPYALYSKYAATTGNGIKSVVDNGDGTLTFTYVDGSTYTTPVLKGLTGPAGPQGAAGANGTNGTNGVGVTNAFIQNDSLYIVLSNGQNLNTGYVKGTAGDDGIILNGTAVGNTTFWNGSKWVVDNRNIYNDGSSVGIGTDSPDVSSKLEINSTTKGVLMPRMTLAQRKLITSPANGLLVYQIDKTPGFYYFNGTEWVALGNSNSTGGTGSDSNTLIYTTNGF